MSEDQNKQDFANVGGDLLRSMAKALVDNDEAIEINVGADGIRTTLFSVRGDKSDLGKLIGKHGKTANAMRTILGAVASKFNRRAVLDIEE